MITNCTFSGNTAESETWYNGGGGMCIFDSESNPVITNCIFSGNTAEWGGGGVLVDWDASATFTNCTFSSNTAEYGGGMDIFEKNNVVITNCLFSGNTATFDMGGGVCVGWDVSATFTNCTFSGNSAAENGGGICGAGPASIITISNCILWGNKAPDGHEIALIHGSTVVDINYCDIKGGQADIYIYYASNTVNWGVGNIDADPCFVDPCNGDLRLLPSSPCIDAGDPNYVLDTNYPTDLDGKPRIVDGDNDGNLVVDMGAYEYNPFLATFEVNERIRIDRTVFRYMCWVAMENRSPHAVENVQLELIDVPDNIDINDPCVSYAYIDAWGTATSEDSNDYCIIDVNRMGPIEAAEIIWRITYDIVDNAGAGQQVAYTTVLLQTENTPGDITGEGDVDFADLKRLADMWLWTGTPGSIDEDIAPIPTGDGIVDFLDFAEMAENWMQ